jgi:hypothetical protein
MLRYYFFFSNSQTHPISRLFKNGYQHVEMLTELENGQVMHLNPRWGRVDLGLTNEHTLAQVIHRLRALGHTAVMYRCPEPDPRAKISRGWAITCATYLAYTIGLPFRGVTPYQLYKTLKSRGGEDL